MVEGLERTCVCMLVLPFLPPPPPPPLSLSLSLSLSLFVWELARVKVLQKCHLALFSSFFIFFSGHFFLWHLCTIPVQLQFEKGYKFFPARSIIRHPSRAQLFQPAVCKPGEGGGGGGTDHGDGSTRPCTQHAVSTDDEVQPLTLDRQTTKGSIILPSSVQPSLGAVPPLLLASAGRGLDSRQQDRIGYCFSSSRLPLSQRSRTYFDSSRTSGRSFRNPPTFRSTASRQQVRSERGLHTMIQSILSDMSVKMHLHGKRRARSREIRVPMDLGSAASRLRSETQKV